MSAELPRDERRQAPRAHLAISAFVTVEGQQLHAKTIDVSNAGMGVLMFRGLPPGTACEIELRWRVGSHFEFIQARTTVAQSVLAAEGGYRVGMRFEDMDEHSRSNLAVLLT